MCTLTFCGEVGANEEKITLEKHPEVAAWKMLFGSEVSGSIKELKERYSAFVQDPWVVKCLPDGSKLGVYRSNKGCRGYFPFSEQVGEFNLPNEIKKYQRKLIERAKGDGQEAKVNRDSGVAKLDAFYDALKKVESAIKPTLDNLGIAPCDPSQLIMEGSDGKCTTINEGCDSSSRQAIEWRLISSYGGLQQKENGRKLETHTDNKGVRMVFSFDTGDVLGIKDDKEYPLDDGGNYMWFGEEKVTSDTLTALKKHLGVSENPSALPHKVDARREHISVLLVVRKPDTSRKLVLKETDSSFQNFNYKDS